MSSGSNGKQQKIVDKAMALELMFSALGYLRGAGIEVRGSNISSGLALVLPGVYLNERGLPVVGQEGQAPQAASTGKTSDSGQTEQGAINGSAITGTTGNE